jgi:hypothetical protein
VEESRSITELKTFRDVIEKLIIPKITAGMFTDRPVELPDGTKTTFTTTRDFYENTLAIYLNGVRQDITDQSDVTVQGNRTIIFKVAPVIGDRIVIDYVPMDI